MTVSPDVNLKFFKMIFKITAFIVIYYYYCYTALMHRKSVSSANRKHDIYSWLLHIVAL